MAFGGVLHIDRISAIEAKLGMPRIGGAALEADNCIALHLPSAIVAKLGNIHQGGFAAFAVFHGKIYIVSLPTKVVGKFGLVKLQIYSFLGRLVNL